MRVRILGQRMRVRMGLKKCGLDRVKNEGLDRVKN